MKTTLDLDDELLIEAKEVAARRRITLKAVVESALRRELMPVRGIAPEDENFFEIGALGLPVLKKRPKAELVTLEQVRALQAELDEEDVRRAIDPPRP
jgi:hypothetical protein